LSIAVKDLRGADVIRFKQLLRALSRGEVQRNTFERWEMEVLLDVLARLDHNGPLANKVLSRYQAVAVRLMRQKGGPPPRFSLYLSRIKRKRLFANDKE